MEWLDEVADALGVTRLSAAEVEQLLDLARVVAHGTERMNAPLATFLAGRAVGGGTDLATAATTVERCAVSPAGS
ncbi:MAG TPA: DUF6457 domain-containing protein [Acidimicrobiales bacterium]|nr:DUF6457 domain-containing protein [Acidimicrobiales bacterium]